MTRYRANDFGNGYLLVVYHPVEGYTSDGVRYTTSASSYITEVTGMPQTKAMEPFKAPIDENQIDLQWLTVKTMPSGIPMQFPDGESYSLIYPEITIPQSAFNTNPQPTDYEVRLESTIGVYGTGLLDAIDPDEMKAQYQKESAFVDLNPGIWDKSSNDWAPTAYYTLADGEKRIKKFTYAMTRASLQDGAGANAIWNITNVTRSDRHYLYTTPAWAKAMSEDEDVISFIQAHGNDKTSLLYPYYADGTKEGISERVNLLLSTNNASKSETFEKYLLNGAPYNGEEEMSDEKRMLQSLREKYYAVASPVAPHETEKPSGDAAADEEVQDSVPATDGALSEEASALNAEEDDAEDSDVPDDGMEDEEPAGDEGSFWKTIKEKLKRWVEEV